VIYTERGANALVIIIIEGTLVFVVLPIIMDNEQHKRCCYIMWILKTSASENGISLTQQMGHRIILLHNDSKNVMCFFHV
jgi:hypothetical protein